MFGTILVHKSSLDMRKHKNFASVINGSHFTIRIYTSGFIYSSKRVILSRKYLIGRFYKNEEFDWPFDLVTVTVGPQKACFVCPY